MAPTLIPFAPVALLPEDGAVAAVAILCFCGAVATVRFLRLPWWWILFPPMTQALLSANIQTLLVPLLVVGQGSLATFLKVYAAVPMAILGRWRECLVTLVALVISAPVLPWGEFFDELPTITANLAEQTHYALPTPILVMAAPLALVALTSLKRDVAAWMAVPALWPSQQYYYGTLAMGTRSSLAAAIVAFPIPGSGLLALLVLAAVTWRHEGRPGWLRSANGLRLRVGPSAR